jgi:hypothetical protein
LRKGEIEFLVVKAGELANFPRWEAAKPRAG